MFRGGFLLKCLCFNPRKAENHIIRFSAYSIVCCILLILTVLLNLVSRLSADFAEWYACNIYPIIVAVFGWIFSIFPFSFMELLFVLLVLFVIYDIIILCTRLKRRFKDKTERCNALKRFASKMIALVICLLFIFTTNCSVNYHRKSVADHLSLTVRKTSASDLITLADILIDKLCSDASKIQSVSDNGASFLPQNHIQTAVDAMHLLSEKYTAFSGYYPSAKPLTSSVLFSYMNITGIYSAFTVEANFNCDVTDYYIPFTICHELSHLRGFMREDEANFIAYLACLASDDEYFNYSGSILAFTYVYNALARIGKSEECKRLWDMLPDVVVSDFSANSEYWAKFDTPVSDIAQKFNDTYLKVNSQADGVQSYGRVVDLLIAYYINTD